MKITSATIAPLPTSFFEPMPDIVVTFEDGTTKRLFSYYPDEISFTPEEFVGLTENEAYALRLKKDVTYLQS